MTYHIPTATNTDIIDWKKNPIGRNSYVYTKSLNPEILAQMPTISETIVDVSISKLTLIRIRQFVESILPK